MESGDDAAREKRFAEIFAEHRDAVMRFAVRRVGTDTADDVVAETFLVVWRRLDSVAPAHLRGWVFGIARGVIANQLRSYQRQDNLVSRIAFERPATTQPSELAEAVGVALAGMPESYREALQLTEWDGLSAAEAAYALGVSAAAFRVRLHRARRRLLRDMQPTWRSCHAANPSAEGIRSEI